MEQINLILAVADLIPISLSIWGFFCLARMIASLERECGRLAYVGVALITLSGLSRIIGRMIAATTGTDILILKSSFYLLMAPGVICMAWAIWNVFRPVGQVPVWVVPVIIITVTEGAAAIRSLSKGGHGWFFIVLGATTLANLAAMILLIRESWRRHLKWVALLFSFQALAIIFQGWLGRILNQTQTLRWIEQLNITFAWGAFFLAARQLERLISRK